MTMVALDGRRTSSIADRVQRMLAWLGRTTRVRTRFVLMMLAVAAGIVVDSVRLSSWRRPARAEFWRVLRSALGGSLIATGFVAVLAGLGMVYQALYWLRVAGQEDLIGTVLVTILVREVAPLLVGIILLGRSGSVMLTELGQLQSERQIHALHAHGIDPFRLLVMPRGVAFALACYTLGIVFVLATLFVGFAVASLLGVVQTSIWPFLDTVMRATAPSDFAVFPIKMLTIGLLVAATICVTALSADPRDDVGRLMARGSVRGILAIMLISGLLSLAV
jgi:phospholipid/cholesterol/gamma-HCH transport system permease protein